LLPQRGRLFADLLVRDGEVVRQFARGAGLHA
jgi:hypothetical protein